MDASEDPTTARNTAFRMANARQTELVKAGVSQSGHERNCCFLNTGTERFANISAAAGLDHIGDGRTYARVDWDHDGDLDLWSTNRTAPRVQFLRNNSDTENHFLAVRLHGNGPTTNRDAIGARVEIKLAGDDRPLIKTLRAGEGFLAQSSKWVHFGLGTNDAVERLIVRWPGGEAEQFTNLEADRHYAIVQGSGRAEVWSRPVTAVELESDENEGPPRTDLARIPLKFPIPLPAFQYKTFAGEQVSLDKYRGSPTLVNLWASWCQPCLAELVEFREHADEIRSAGLTIVALSVDAVAEDAAANQDKAQSLWEKQKFPFQAGMADTSLVQQIEVIVDFLFDHRRRWTVPTSFLLNSEGHLAAIYIGRVDIDELISDVSALQSDEQAWFLSSLPFAGRWADERRLPDMWPFVAKLFEKNYVAEAVDYFTRLEKLQAPSDTFPELLFKVAIALNDRGDHTAAAQRLRQSLELLPDNANSHVVLANVLSLDLRVDEAIEHCREAIKLQPELGEAHFGLGKLLASQGKLDEAVESYRQAVRLEPEISEWWIAMGTAYAMQADWHGAAGSFERATELSPDSAEAQFQRALALRKSGDAEQAVPAFERGLELDPTRSKMVYSYGATLAALGRTEDAIEQLRKGLVLSPDSVAMLNGIAWMIATQEKVPAPQAKEAVRFAEKAAQLTGHQHPQVLDTLAATQAAAGKFDDALATARQALKLAEAAGSKDLSRELRGRVGLYRKKERFVEFQQAH